MINEILEFNKKFVEDREYEKYKASKYPEKKLAILSCMDTRLTALLPAALGLKNGDAKIIKNAGAVITHPFGSVVRSLLVAIVELGVEEVMVIGHTDCGVQHIDANMIIEHLKKRGISTENVELLKYAYQTYEFQDEETRDGEAYRLNREKMVQSYKEQMEDCQDAILVHNMKLQEYRQNVKEGTMVAPASGVITVSQVDLVGTISKPSEKVITMIANDALIFVSEEADKEQYLEFGQTYDILVGKGESQKVVEVTLMEEEETEYEDAEEKICFAIQTPDLKLETGAQGVIWITLEEKKDVLYVPNEVLHTGGGKTYVYTMSDNGIRNINYVTTGVSDREKTEIVEGLSEGQYVLQE